jgi:AAA family ATP:ADP antiporter
MLALFAVFGGAWIAVVAIVTRGSAYGIFQPASDSIYTQVDAETRYKTKTFIDTSLWRFGDVVVYGGLNGLRLLGATSPMLALLTVVAAASSASIGWKTAKLLDGGAARKRPAA